MIAVIGEFDGYHLGHRALFSEARRLAQQKGAGWGVLTFSPYPREFFEPSGSVLFTERTKSLVAKFLEIPKVITLRFNDVLSKMEPLEFLQRIKDDLGLTGIVVGSDFRFGKDAGGDTSLIKRFCEKEGLECSIVELVDFGRAGMGRKMSSSSMRNWCEMRAFDKIRRVLGFPYPISGTVIHGDGRGAQMGFSTANLEVPHEQVVPASGIYAASIPIGNDWKPCAVFIGVSPTFGSGTQTKVEVHIIGYSGNLYGKQITVFIEECLGAPKKYDNSFELVKAIARYVKESTDIFQTRYSESKFVYDQLQRAFSSEPEPARIINLAENFKAPPVAPEYQKVYITLDKSAIKEIFHPNFIENLNCSLAEAIVRPGKCTERHVHTESTEIYYGLDGAGFIYVEGEDKAVITAGSAVLIPRGTPHHVCANDDKDGKPLTFLCFCSPPYRHEQTKLIHNP